jgi:hypothetical protein
MSYKILSHWTKEGLEHQVIAHLKKGWELSGSATVSMTDTYASSGKEPEYLQAVTKPKEVNHE